MKFSAQEEYGLRCLMQIARQAEGSVTIPEIGRAEGLSATHVAKLLMLLRKGGFITSTRGQSGGYTLSRPAEQIYVSDVLAELGGRLYDDHFCGKHSGQLNECLHNMDCEVRSLWNRIQSAVDRVLDHVTLADIMAGTIESPNVRLYATLRKS